MSIVTIVLVAAAVALPPLMQLGAWIILDRAAKGDPVMALLERLRVAQAGFVGSTIISLLAINGLLGHPVISGPPYSTILIALALLIIAAPAGVFVWLFLTGRFGDQ